MNVVQVVRTSRADPFFSYCASGKDCPLTSPLTAPVPLPVTSVPPLSSPDLTQAKPEPAARPAPANGPSARASIAAQRNDAGLTIAFLYKSAIFPASARPLLEHWLSAKDQPGSRYLVVVHTEDSGPISRKLARDRGDAVSDAIHQLLPPKRLDRTSVFDPYGRQVVIIFEPISEASVPSATPAAPTPSTSASAPLQPTSAAPLAQPPQTVPSVSRGEGSQEKSP